MTRKPNGYWTKERCITTALGCTSYYDFQVNHPNVYQKARKSGWLEEIRPLLPSRNPNGWWTKDRCAEEALKYEKRKYFEKGCRAAYGSARLNGWLDEICAHMPKRVVRENGFWTMERLREAASIHETRVDFERENRAAYSAAVRLGVLDEICQHTKPLILPHGHWTKERCEDEAWKYNTTGSFRYFCPGGFEAAKRNGWLEEIAWHMDRRKPVDAVYLIRESNPLGQLFLVKVGVTRWDLGDRRVVQGFRHFDKPVVVIHQRVINALKKERAVLNKFTVVPEIADHQKVDGHTELRMMTAEEIGEAVRMIDQ